MIVRSVGYKNSGRPTNNRLPDNSTVADLASALGVSSDSTDWMVNGDSATPSTPLSDGDFVQYTMRNIKAA